MIRGFRDRWLEEFFVRDLPSRQIPPELETRLFRKLQLLDDAMSDSDLRVPPSNHFEKLRGNLAGWYSIRVNDQWRLIFRWDGGSGEAAQVYLDNHNYR
ncbi:MAG: type II toxin-antitoxin system RelE/ParE family toxin [Terracidiphilus sp.]|jgi:proteic killer suppression protein